MKQFTLSLVKNSLRPVVKLESWNNFRALLDTGAFFPIWTAEEEILNDLGGRILKKCFFQWIWWKYERKFV